MSESAGSEIATMTGTQMSSSSSSSSEGYQRTPRVSGTEESSSCEDSSNGSVPLQDERFSSLIVTSQRSPSPREVVEQADDDFSSPIATPQRMPSSFLDVDIDIDNEQPDRDSSSSSETEVIAARDFFFILEEILGTSTSTLLRPATIRAVCLDEDEAGRVLKRLVHECDDNPAARKVCPENIFKDGVFMGEGYEFHTRRLKLRTLWIQEGVQEEDAEVVESDGESVVSEEAGGGDGVVRIQGGGARLSGGGWSLSEVRGV